MASYSNNMMEKLKTVISMIVIILFLPYLVTFVVQGDFLNPADQEDVQENSVDQDTQQLVLILAKEMPASYEKEALKAQAVIARTNLAYARKHDQTEPEGVSWEDMRARLGAEEFQKCYELLKNCVEETAGEEAVYKKKVVQLPYHFVSAGQTRNASEINDTNDMPYVKAVSSAQDLSSERFLKVEFLSKKQFRNKLKAAYPEMNFTENDKDGVEKLAEVAKRDSSAYVLTVKLPGKSVSGEEIRKVFSLNSACFSIKEVDGQVRIVTKGYGQGYGLSQYGANEMAKEGSTYKEILEYYYSGIKIKSVKSA